MNNPVEKLAQAKAEAAEGSQRRRLGILLGIALGIVGIVTFKGFNAGESIAHSLDLSPTEIESVSNVSGGIAFCLSIIGLCYVANKIRKMR